MVKVAPLVSIWVMRTQSWRLRSPVGVHPSVETQLSLFACQIASVWRESMACVTFGVRPGCWGNRVDPWGHHALVLKVAICGDQGQ